MGDREAGDPAQRLEGGGAQPRGRGTRVGPVRGREREEGGHVPEVADSGEGAAGGHAHRQRPPAVERVARALAPLDAAATEAERAAARAELARWGWLDLDAVEDTARTWLRRWDPRQKTEGLRLAGALHLGDLGEDVRSALAFATHLDLWNEGLAAAKVLGVRTDGLIAPVR